MAALTARRFVYVVFSTMAFPFLVLLLFITNILDYLAHWSDYDGTD